MGRGKDEERDVDPRREGRMDGAQREMEKER